MRADHPCPLWGECGGCSGGSGSAAEWAAARELAAQERWQKAGLALPASWTTVSVGDGQATRERADVAWDGRALGLLHRDGHAIVDAPACPKHVPKLAQLYARLRLDPPPISKANIRLRVSPCGGHEGLWIDGANVDIKAVLDESAWLARWSDVDVALGQRGRYAVFGEGRWKLEKHVPLRPWGRTHCQDGRSVDVWTHLSGFTQPGSAVSRCLVDTVLDAVGGGGRWLEVGAGAGQLTVPLVSTGATVTALEPDAGARRGWHRTVESVSREMPALLAMSAQDNHAALSDALSHSDGVLADPPRSGLGSFVSRLGQYGTGVGRVVLVSCGEQAMVEDVVSLGRLGFEAEAIYAIDAFPWTRHAERVVVLDRRL